MKVRLLRDAHVHAPAGSELELADSRARILIAAGLAVKAEEPVVEMAIQEPMETAAKKAPARKRKKKEE